MAACMQKLDVMARRSATAEAALAEKARESFGDVPDDVQAVAHRSLIDCIGVTLSGTQYPMVASAARAAGFGLDAGEPRARILGLGLPASTRAAALANTMAGHIDDFDDSDPLVSLAHPTVSVLYSALATAEALDLDTRDLLRAHCVGIEALMRVGMVCNPGHYNAGYHASASLGLFGSVIAVGLLRRFDAPAIENALNIAASMAAGIKGNFGSDMKSLQVGQASANAITACALSAAGISGARGALFGPAGFLSMSGPLRDSREILDGFGAPHAIQNPGINIKVHPCCACCSPGVDSLIEVLDKHRLRADDVARIDAWVGRDVPAILRYDVPKNGLEGKFSLKYTLAVALKARRLTLSDFEDDAVLASDLQRNMERIAIHVDENTPLSVETAVTMQTRVEVTTRSGERISNTVTHPRGSPANPISDADLKAKFVQGAERALGDDGAWKAFAALSDLRAGVSTRQLVDALCARTGPA